ncbi:cAMP phosphodiesterases class-II-domain-containing protein [Lactifluus subvellereus]|nr:cAMP phosphodiesterases class-II-domain-containing protein [Lactifluus subvellereus]
MPTFDLVVVGSGGGPYETNLSSYLFKPCDARWADGIIALEAGSGIGTLHQLLSKDRTLFDLFGKLSARQVYSRIHCFLISHAHLDHVNGLVLSAGSLDSSEKRRKRVCAPLKALKILETIFSDRVWPNLASWDADDAAYKLLYDPLMFDDSYRTIFPDVSVKAMPVLHGKNDTAGDYESSAFFIHHDPSGKEFLFFGDVSPDSLVLAGADPLTIAVWRAAAPKIPDALSTIFIECSWPSGRPNALLYGHLSPEHLVDELAALAAEVTKARAAKAAVAATSTDDALPTRRRKRKKRRADTSPAAAVATPDSPSAPLAGLRVYIIHCKEDEDLEREHERPIAHIIRDQVDALVQAKSLGAEILSAEQGMTISTHLFALSPLR